MKYFQYGDREINHLKKNDKILGRAIDIIGPVKRKIYPNLFEALVYHIVGQQISTKALYTVWDRIVTDLKEVTPERVLELEPERLQSHGLTFKKVDYIISAAKSIVNGDFNIEELHNVSDEEALNQLVKLKGVGPWTAEMLLVSSLERRNIISFGDLAIIRAMEILYGYTKVTRKIFDSHKEDYSPYASVASLYLWEIYGGALERGYE